MNARISVEFAIAEGALVRMIGLIERRGFEVRGLGMTEHETNGTASMVVELTPRDSTRRLEILDLQLRRLHGVCDVITLSPAAKAAS